jgi:hypothetical protein
LFPLTLVWLVWMILFVADDPSEEIRRTKRHGFPLAKNTVRDGRVRASPHRRTGRKGLESALPSASSILNERGAGVLEPPDSRPLVGRHQ